jgi:hypothetical protein
MRAVDCDTGFVAFVAASAGAPLKAIAPTSVPATATDRALRTAAPRFTE